MAAADDDAWMPLLVGRYMRDTTHLTTEQHGAYLLLIMDGWNRGGVLPAQDAQLAAIARVPAGRWRTLIKPVLMPFFRPDGNGGLVQKRLSIELQRIEQITERLSEGGKNGARKRWQSDSQANGQAIEKHGKNDGKRIATPLARPLARPSHGGSGGSPIPSSPSAPTPSGNPQHGLEADASSPRRAGEGGPTATTPGEVCKAIKAAGVVRCNPANPTLRAMLAQGVTLDEILGGVNKALEARADDPFAYALRVVEGERRRAAELHLAPPAPARPGSMADFQRQLSALKGQA